MSGTAFDTGGSGTENKIPCLTFQWRQIRKEGEKGGGVGGWGRWEGGEGDAATTVR